MLKLDKRFFDKVNTNGPVIVQSPCWEWTAGKDNDGYGHFKIWIDGKKVTRKAHRLSYEYEFGPFDKTLYVCHSCDNPSCVNPNHLFLGTAKDNNNYAAKKGRYKAPSGDKHWTRSKKQLRDSMGKFSKSK
jgi:hypothetical protein